jgi:hypothetical protein
VADDLLVGDDPGLLLARWVEQSAFQPLSRWTLVAGDSPSWPAARVQVAQAAEIQRQQDEPVEEKIVEKIVEQTEINRTDDTTHG